MRIVIFVLYSALVTSEKGNRQDGGELAQCSPPMRHSLQVLSVRRSLEGFSLVLWFLHSSTPISKDSPSTHVLETVP